MLDQWIRVLSDNAPTVITAAGVIGGIALLALYVRARVRHVTRLRDRLNGVVKLPKSMMDALSKVLNVDAVEFTTIGAVTFVDVAWHYSMADPHIWDHFQGPGASHIADAIQNLDVLRSSLGSQAGAILGNVGHYLQLLEATSVYHETLARLAAVGTVASAVALDAPASAVIERLSKAGAATIGIDAKASAALSHVAGDTAGLLVHIPLVTIGFASYRAWKRHQAGAGLPRNLEFAAIEVAARAGGGLAGSQLGGAIGTAVAPGLGTIVGGIAGAVAGAIGGAIVGEEFKQRHVKGAQQKLDTALTELGAYHLRHPGRFRELTEIFSTQEREYEKNLSEMQWRLASYSLLPWRTIWPNEKLVLLQETVKMAEDRLGTIKKGALEAVDQLTYMRDRSQHKEMGAILWSDPALRQQLTVDSRLVTTVEQSTSKLRHEIGHLGKLPQAATA